MATAWDSLEGLLRHDPGQRGIAALGQPGALRSAARALAGARRVLIASGFPVWSGPPGTERELLPESDGPPGAVALGRALVRIGAEVGAGAEVGVGVEVEYLTDARSAPLFRAMGVEPRVATWSGAVAADGARELLATLGADAVVSIELPGRGQAGRYWSMRGEALDTPALDEVLLAAEARGLLSLAIGDGGNEAGLACLAAGVARLLPLGERIATTVAARHVLAAGVSNWGAYALLGGLSLIHGRCLVPSEDETRRDLEAVAAAGGVDGILKTRGLEVDGQPFAATAAALTWARSVLD